MPTCDSCGKDLERFYWKVVWIDGQVTQVDDQCRPQVAADVVEVKQHDLLAEMERDLETST